MSLLKVKKGMKVCKLVLICSLFLILSGFISYLVFRHMYARELSLRLSPVMENNNQLIKNEKYWFLGDSRIARWTIPDSILPRSTYCNLGVDGQTSTQVLYRIRLYFEKQNPDYIFLQVGINDLKTIGLFPNIKTQIIDQCIQNIKAILSESITHGAKPVFLTIFPGGDVELLRRPLWNMSVNKAVVNVNKEIIEYSRSNNIPIIDSYTILCDKNGKLRKEFQKDCLHLNKNGYAVLNKEVNKFILSLRK